MSPGPFIVITPVCRRRHELDGLLEAITPETKHREFNPGRAVGRVAW